MDMDEMKQFFDVVISDDKMFAEIHCLELPSEDDLSIVNKENILKLLNDLNIQFGIDMEAVQSIIDSKSLKKFPIKIAQGLFPEDGIDGEIIYHYNKGLKIDKDSDWHFRDVMRIPSVIENQKLATIIRPTDGKDGKNIFGQIIQAKTGKRVMINAGKNVIFNEEDLSFYSQIEGQVVTTENIISVQPVYEINEDLSMKTGNIDFIGTVIIRGNVPTGYMVKARGDIKIFGIVEAATIESGGSVYISEGLAGLQKGKIEAEQSVYIGYVNQGIVHAKDSIYVDNSIIHSEIIAKNNVHCKHGNIIGGTVNAGHIVEAKDIGNRLNTKTKVILGDQYPIHEKRTELLSEKKELNSTLQKLEIIRRNLAAKQNDAKIRVTLLRQKHSKMKIKEKLATITKELEKIDRLIKQEEGTYLIVQNAIYPNVIIAFNKYEHNINRIYNHVKIQLDQNEVVIQSLDD